jgi:hypothetical protein
MPKYTPKPGVIKDESPLVAGLFFVDADKGRFRGALPESLYGWERASTSVLLGYCRGGLTWTDGSKNPFAAFGTNLRAYAMNADGTTLDITPVSARGFGTTVNLTTTNGSAVVAANWTAHGLVQDQKFTWEDATVTAVGGVTVNGTYVVLSVTDADNFTFTAAQTATSGAGPTATVVSWTRFLAPGLADGLAGSGYGTGGWSSGGYGGSSSLATLYTRTWSGSPFGQNALLNPRGGGIYEFAPNFTATELVTNGTFTGSATGWTTGPGWAYGINNVVATASNGDLSQSIALPAASWCLLKANISSYTSGSVQPKVAGAAVGSALSAAGRTAAAFFSGSGGTVTLAMSCTTANLTLDDVSVQVETYAQLVPNAPTQCTCMFVTAEGNVVACGVPDDVSSRFDGAFNPLRVVWSARRDNQTWTPATSNLAGGDTLTSGSYIVRGLPTNRENVIFTNIGVWTMRSVPDINVIYTIDELASDCGLIGPNAVAEVGGTVYWMDPNGGFWSYSGSFPTPLGCTIGRDIRDNLAPSQQDKIYASVLTVNGVVEVWWFYPDFRDGNECSRYAIYSVTESQLAGYPVWCCGTFNRTTYLNAGVFPYPLAVDATGTIWFHEKGFSEDGGARSGYFTSGYMQGSKDGAQTRLSALEPDAAGVQGAYSIAINTRTRSSNGILTRAYGPYPASASTGLVPVRASGEDYQFTFTFSGAPSFWRLGSMGMDAQLTGRRR